MPRGAAMSIPYSEVITVGRYLPLLRFTPSMRDCRLAGQKPPHDDGHASYMFLRSHDIRYFYQQHIWAYVRFTPLYAAKGVYHTLIDFIFMNIELLIFSRFMAYGGRSRGHQPCFP